jgi:hypothetical protein
MSRPQTSDYINLNAGQGACTLCGKHTGDMQSQGGRALKPFHVREADGSLRLVHTSDRVCLGHPIHALPEALYEKVKREEQVAFAHGRRFVAAPRPIEPPEARGIKRRDLGEDDEDFDLVLEDEPDAPSEGGAAAEVEVEEDAPADEDELEARAREEGLELDEKAGA